MNIRIFSIYKHPEILKKTVSPVNLTKLNLLVSIIILEKDPERL